MLARIAHELYWVGRSLSRAEHTARLLDGVFHADLQGPATDAGSARAAKPSSRLEGYCCLNPPEAAVTLHPWNPG